jgi:hypothetical protein
MILDHSLKAFYNVQVFSRDGIFLRETGFFQNLLPDQFFENFIGGSSNTSSSLFSFCQAGSGTGTPANTDSTITAVGNRFARLADGIADALENVIAVGNVLTCTTAYISAVGLGVGGGNISELAIFNQVSGGIMVSRALIKTVLGVPTAITIAADEYVKVLYKIQVTVDHADKTGSFVYNSVTYNWTARPMAWNNALSLAPKLSTNFWVFPKGGIVDSANGGFGLNQAVAGDSNTLAAITARPTYTSSSTTSSVSAVAYTANSKQRKIEYTFGASQGNIAGGIGGIMIQNALGQSGFQIAFTPKFPKVSPNTFKVGITHQFSR